MALPPAVTQRRHDTEAARCVGAGAAHLRRHRSGEAAAEPASAHSHPIAVPKGGWSGTVSPMSTAIQTGGDGPHGTSLLPHDLTAQELAATPTIDDIGTLVIDDLTDEEYEAFLDAITS